MALTGVMLADFSAFRKEADASAASLKQVESGADTAASKLSKLSDPTAIKQGITDPLGTATTAATGFAESIGPVGVAAAAATGLLVTMGTATLKLATDAAEVVAAFDDMADKTGMSVPALSRMSNAAQVVGADMHVLTDTVFKLEQKMGEGGEAFEKGLAAMGTSTAELKAVGPDRYLEVVTAGLQSIQDPSARAAAGNAVLGKSYKDVAASLNDLATGMKLTADIEPFTAQQAADAEAFQFQVASIKTHISAASTAIGNELIPAASGMIAILDRTGVALVHIADLGGLVSGAWHGIKLSLGEADLAQQTMLANTEMVNRLFSEQGATAESVAEKLLNLGFSEQNVATLTGLTTDAVHKLNVELTGTKTAAETNAAAWDRVNAALAAGPPSLDGVSMSMRGLAVDMKAAGAEMKDITATTGVTAGQMALLEKQVNATKTAFADWEKATKALEAAMIPWQESLDSVPPKLQEQIKIGLSVGVSQDTLAKAYKLTAEQVKAVSIAMDEDTKAMNANADMAKEMGERRLEIEKEMLKATNDRVVAEFTAKKAAEEKEAAFLKANLADAQAQDAIQQNLHRTTEVAQTELQKRAAAAKAAYDEAYKDASVNQDKINALSRAWQDANAAANAEVRSNSTTTAGAIGDAFSLNFQRSTNEFENFRGVVVAGTAQIMTAAGQSAGAYVQMQKDMRDAQNARCGFYIDTGFAPPPIQTRDSGGPVVAGTSYLIGGGKAPEIFTPGANGFVTPNAVGGVHVNNVFNIVDTESNITRRVADNITRSIMAAQKL